MEKNNEWLKKVPERIGWYLAGFVDGEGSFNVSLRKRADHKSEWQVVLTFNVAQRDISNLTLLKKHLGCGRLQYRKDGVHYFVVSNYKAIHERVVPFFKRFNFFSVSKKKNFSLFQQITSLMNNNEHLTEEGLKQIVSLREQLNVGRGRTRKYNIQDVYKNHQSILRDYTSDPSVDGKI